ncbi:Tma108p KNAG_0E01680 [Huiozyma naganishii CBS 8797]|uniref:Aminopeptidase n=1 Tax=Huiozyma naganishii (strain ATCC MYA-139 / BCRC 22969 / CBS 8797 / KCTC 17520 / NBRC 10181 / NCYC 3082 / Yp74L-3) TaxID=1071383 RepID=J7R6F0_HUIN7|nr:hypothetical protein KNAG_0E01680 [Kazachstania naganishii CBS 8797]CCK70430.1 hypothetical protein KNAG_0E01680 [Kazachstania naganishii CBS 8797]
MLALENGALPTEYRLALDFTQKQCQRFAGRAEIRLHAVRECTQFALHGSGLDVSMATLDLGLGGGGGGAQQLAVESDGGAGVLVFRLPEGPGAPVFAEGAAAWLTVVYTGVVHSDGTYGVFSGGPDCLATHAQPRWARTIYPCIDEPSVKCSYTLQLLVPPKHTAVSVSPGASSSPGEWLFERTKLLPTSLFAFSFGAYEKIMTTAVLQDDVKCPITVYGPRGAAVARAAFALDTMQKFLPQLEQFFQCKYPNKKCDLLLVPALEDKVMENSSMITAEASVVLLSSTQLASPEVQFQMQQLLVHEMVHQWVGCHVTFNSWDHLWFDEAFATWVANDVVSESQYWLGEHYTGVELRGTMLQEYTAAGSVASLSRSRAGDDRLHTSQLFEPFCYQKGINILRMLQRVLVDGGHWGLFQESMKQWFKDCHKGSVAPMDLWKISSDCLKTQNLPNFIYSWTHSQGFPLVTVTDTAGTIHIEQHVYPPLKHKNSEDVPYHVPLFGPAGQIAGQVLMTDRSLDVNRDQFAWLNDTAQGYYMVSYEDPAFYNTFVSMLQSGGMSDEQMAHIVRDIRQLATDGVAKQVHFDGIVTVLQSNKELPLTLPLALDTLLLAPLTDNVQELALKLTQGAPPAQTRAQLLVLCRNDKGTAAKCQELYANLFGGSRNHRTPLRELSGVLAVVVANMKTPNPWKKLAALATTTGATAVLPHIELPPGIAQTEAVHAVENATLASMGYVQHPDLVRKLLNYCSEHIDSRGIHVPLQTMARQSPAGSGAQSLWDWFNGNYAMWIKRHAGWSPETPQLLSILDTVIAARATANGDLPNAPDHWPAQWTARLIAV